MAETKEGIGTAERPESERREVFSFSEREDN